MNKETILSYFNEEEEKDAIKVYEKYKLAYEKDIPVFTSSFLNPNLWSFFEYNCRNEKFQFEANGIFSESERRMVSFNNIYDVPFPIIILKIENKSSFSTLKHKDYLGAIMSLGIERNKLGDLILIENSCYLPVTEDISNYIILNLNKIGRSPVEIKVIEDLHKVPSLQFEEIIINVKSLRIDSVVAKLINASRSIGVQFIDNGKVLLNYVKSKDKSQEIKFDDRITIRGTGKFIIGNLIGDTKSGKHKILVKKYK
nr:YlmH/Sll1252 family protein [Clostridium sp.]